MKKEEAERLKLEAYSLGLDVGRRRTIERIIEALGLDERYALKDSEADE